MGTTALWFAQCGYQVVACDVSSEAIRITEQRAAAEHLPLRTQVGDILGEEVEGTPYDAVFSRGVLHTFTETLDGSRSRPQWRGVLLSMCSGWTCRGVPTTRTPLPSGCVWDCRGSLWPS